MPSYLCRAERLGLSGRWAAVAMLLCHWAVMVLLWLLKAVRAPSCVAASAHASACLAAGALLLVLRQLLLAVLLWLTVTAPAPVLRAGCMLASCLPCCVCAVRCHLCVYHAGQEVGRTCKRQLSLGLSRHAAVLLWHCWSGCAPA